MKQPLRFLRARPQARFDAAAVLLCTFAACGVGMSAACGDDASARYAGLSTIQRSASGYSYRLRYRAPPWKPIAKDPLSLGEISREIIGGGSRAIEAASGSVLEIGSTTVAVVVGQNFPKYRLEAAFVRCDADTLGDADTCAAALAELELTARGKSGRTLDRSSEATPHRDVLGRSDEFRRNQRIAFFETPDSELALWVFIDAYPDLEEVEIDQMLGAIDITRDVEAP